jgi:hypothetical protein
MLLKFQKLKDQSREKLFDRAQARDIDFSNDRGFTVFDTFRQI